MTSQKNSFGRIEKEMMTEKKRKKVQVFCLTYGEPAENTFPPQFEYSHLILNRLTRRVAPIPKFVTPLLAARRARERCRTFIEKEWNSPLEEITLKQVEQIDELLSEMRPDCDFECQMVTEFRPPLLDKYLDVLEHDPPDEILVIPLYVAESDFTSGISRTDFEQWHKKKRGKHHLPAPKYTVGLGFEDVYADAIADYILRKCDEAGWTEEQRKNAALILGAHGTVVTIPPGMNSGAQETGNHFRLLRKRLKDKFGWMRIGWLNHTLGGMWTTPSVEEAAKEAQEEKDLRNVIYFPFGFIGDNGESMLEGQDQLDEYEWENRLDIPCPNDDKEVLKAVCHKAIEVLEGPEASWKTVGEGNKKYIRPEPPILRGEETPFSLGPRPLAIIAAAFWLLLGIFLTKRGVQYYFELDSNLTAIIVLLAATYFAYIKGKHVFVGLAIKNLTRISRLPIPSNIKHVFSKASWIVIAVMAVFGMSLRAIPMADSLRAFILLTVGPAMLAGAYTYFAKMEIIEKRSVEKLAKTTRARNEAFS